MKAEYLLFNLLIIILPLISMLFYKKAKKPSKKYYVIFIPAVFFILTDIFVTGWFWDFNPSYVLGFYFFTIPFEELMFFFTVPFACLFLWNNLCVKGRGNNSIYFSIIPLFFFGLIFLLKSRYYTASVFILLAMIFLLDFVIGSKVFLLKKTYLFLLIVIALTFIFNLYLTYRPVVIYNEIVKTGFNIISIPFEDFVYGLSLISLNIIFFEKK